MTLEQKIAEVWQDDILESQRNPTDDAMLPVGGDVYVLLKFASTEQLRASLALLPDCPLKAAVSDKLRRLQ